MYVLEKNFVEKWKKVRIIQRWVWLGEMAQSFSKSAIYSASQPSMQLSHFHWAICPRLESASKE